MASYRLERINEQLTHEMADIVRDIKDPRVSRALVSIMSCDCTADLKLCKVYFSVIGGEAADVKKGLVSANGFIRSELAKRVNLRITPELKFIYDNSAEHAARINELFKQIEKTKLPDSVYENDTENSEEGSNNG